MCNCTLTAAAVIADQALVLGPVSHSAALVDAVSRIEELAGLRPGMSGSLLVYGLCSGCAA